MPHYETLQNLASRSSYFVYNLDKLYNHAKEIASGQAKLFFACKANPLSSILNTLKRAGVCFDVASSGELSQVLSIGVPGKDIIMTGPAKPEQLLKFALENKVSTFVIESPAQLMCLQKLAKDYGYQPNVLLRLQLQWNEEDKNAVGGNKTTAFGMDQQTLLELLPKVQLPLLGFHVFQWGNILSIYKLRYVWERTMSACKSLTEDFQVLDVGGGLGIPYAAEAPLAWKEVNSLVKELKDAYNIKEFWLEMGRYLTGPCGIYVTSVVDCKETYGKKILVLDGGINHIARPALVNESFPLYLLRESEAKLAHFFIHGPLCTSLDFLGKHMLPEDTRVGDVIVFMQTGAYGFTESLPFFLCHDLPGEAVLENKNLSIIREPQSAQFWLK